MAGKNPVILAVDDNKINLLLVRECLCSEFQVITRRSVQAALDYLQTHSPPDLILSDLWMPGQGGLDLIRKVDHEFNLPVIIVSGICEESYVNKAFEAGALDYICKPLNINVLRNKIFIALDHLQYEN
jgi:CheY-like chemotaxis protein